MSEQQVINGETGHKYFHMMLNMADDDLNAQEYRLLGHYLRWAGHGGSHEEGIRQTAKVCHMAKSTVEKTRVKLVTKGYLEVTKPTPDEAKEGKPTIITVIDRWNAEIESEVNLTSEAAGVAIEVATTKKPVNFRISYAPSPPTTP